MQPALIHPGLAHRLLVAAARAHYDGEAPLDWEDLAALAGVRAGPRPIRRALDGLADDGLIEGISTPAGWLAVHPTARGLARAGRAARRPLKTAAPLAPLIEDSAKESDPKPERKPLVEMNDGLRQASARAAEAGERVAASLRPRVTAARDSLAQAWHTLTTLP